MLYRTGVFFALQLAFATSSASDGRSSLRATAGGHARNAEVGRSLSTSREGVWSLWKSSESACNMCLDTDIHELDASSENFQVGCISDASTHPDIPACDLSENSAAKQAGGHIGSMISLRDGKTGKESQAFDDLGSTDEEVSLKAKRTKIFHRVEYEFYMQLWCLKKLRNRGHIKSSHVLDPFVIGSNPWAPEFSGVCRLPPSGDSQKEKLYLVMQNLTYGYAKSSILDIKLGISVEPDSADLYSGLDYLKRQKVDAWSATGSHGARLAGYNLHDFKTDTWNDFHKKGKVSQTWEQSKSLKSIFSTSFEDTHQSEDIEMISFFGSRLQDMFLWWTAVGQNELRAVSSSVFFSFEGIDKKIKNKKFNLHLIDFAHTYNSTSREDWDDKVVLGLTSVMRRVDKMLQRSQQPPTLQYQEVCSGQKCKTPCVKPKDGSREAIFAPGVLEFRCESLAKSLNFTYFSWEDKSKQQDIQCLLCNKLESAKSGRRRRYWDGDKLKVYKRPSSI